MTTTVHTAGQIAAQTAVPASAHMVGKVAVTTGSATVGKSGVKLKASTAHVHHACASHSGDPAPAVERATKLLKSAGLKSTRPRQALIDAMAVFQAPFSTEDLHRQVSRKRSLKNAKPEFDLVTVYRSLSTFTDLGIVSRVDLGDGVVRYELASADGTHHHHFICKACQKIEPLDFCEIELQEDRLAKAGYKQLSHRLEFFGICPDCAVTRP